jgi:hypothetical protein
MKKVFSSLKYLYPRNGLMLNRQIINTQKFNHSHDQSGDKGKCPYLHYQQSNTNLIRNKAPEFSGMAWWKDDFKKISVNDFQGKWVCLFFYPLDFTFVCPTEIVDFNNAAEEFNKLSKS